MEVGQVHAAADAPSGRMRSGSQQWTRWKRMLLSEQHEVGTSTLRPNVRFGSGTEVVDMMELRPVLGEDLTQTTL